MLEAALGIAVATEFAVVSRVPGSACVLIPTAIRVWLSVVSNWFSADGGRDGAQRRGGAVVCWDAREAPAAACLLPAEVVQAGLLTVNWASLKRRRRRSVLRESWGEWDRLPVLSDLRSRVVFKRVC